MGKLQGVADTLFIPLAARIYASRRFPAYFYDETALRLEDQIPDETLQQKSGEYEQMASVARYHNLDEMTRAFLAKHPVCNIVNLGAGLETAYFRLKNRTALFYEVDLPAVIESRRAVLGEFPNEILIGGDLFDFKWAEQINKNAPTLLIVSGVFQYFHEEEVLAAVEGLKRLFPLGELIFDATNETGIKYTNRYVRKTGNTAAAMYFFVNDCEAFARKSGTKLVERRPFFGDARTMLAKKLGLYTRIAMKVVDEDGRAVLLHLKLH